MTTATHAFRVTWAPLAEAMLARLSDSARAEVRAKVSELCSLRRQTSTRKVPRSAILPRFEIVYTVDANAREVRVLRVLKRAPPSNPRGGHVADLLGSNE